MITMTIQSLRWHFACYLDARIDDLRRAGTLAEPTDEIPLREWWALSSTSTKDRLWSLRAVTQRSAARRIGGFAAARAARRVLPLASEEGRAAALVAIEAAEACVADPSAESWRVAREAALGARRYAARADAAYVCAGAVHAAACAAHFADAAGGAEAVRAAADAAAYAAFVCSGAASDAAYVRADTVTRCELRFSAERAARVAEWGAVRADLDELLAIEDARGGAL